MKKHTIAPKFYLGHRRLLSLILGLILLLGCMQVFPAAAAAGSPPAVVIEYNGKPAEKLIAEGKTGVAAGEGLLKYPSAQEYVEKRSRRIIQMTKILEEYDKEDSNNG